MPTIGRTPEPLPPESRLAVGQTVQAQAPSQSPQIETRPEEDAPAVQDRYQTQGGYEHLQTASLGQLQDLIGTRGTEVPDRIAVAGGDLVIGFGTTLLRANMDQLAGLIAPNGQAADTVLGRSLLVFETANRAHLPPSAIKALLQGYAELVPQHGSADALQKTFAQISMASLVEAYVQAKDGLATDVRRVASFAEDALNPELAGGATAAIVNRALGRQVLLDRQEQLDTRLHSFSEAFASARFNGDYSTAFDSLQSFFQSCAGATESLHWRLRAADPTSACPPLPERSDSLGRSKLLDAAMQVPAPAPRLETTAVARPGLFRKAVSFLKSGLSAIGSLFTRSAPVPSLAARGFVGVGKAADVVRVAGSTAAVGRAHVGDDQQPSVTVAEKLLVQQFGDDAGKLVEDAAASGHLPHLVRVAHASHGHPAIHGTALLDLMGSPPVPERLNVLATALQLTKDRGTTDAGATKAFFQRLLKDPLAAQLAPLAGDVLAASHKSSTIADLTDVLDKATTAKATGKSDFEATVAALRPVVMTWVADTDSSVFTLFNRNATDMTSLKRLVQDIRTLPPHTPPKAKLAVALLPPHLRQEAADRAKRLHEKQGKDLVLTNADTQRLLADLPAGPAFDRCLELLDKAQAFWQKDRLDHLIALSRKLAERKVPPISQQQIAQALRAVYGVQPPPVDSLATLLDSRATTIGFNVASTHKPVPAPTVTLAPTMTDLAGFRTTGASGGVSVSPTQWFVNAETNQRLLVKLADPVEGFPDIEPYVAAMERQVAVLGNQLGLPVNVVQVVPVTQLGEAIDIVAQGKLQAEQHLRAQLQDPPLTAEEQLAFVEDFKQKYETHPYASVHTPVGDGCIPLTQFGEMVGLPDAALDYRAEGILHTDSGKGASAWMHTDAAAYMQRFKDGITRQVLDNGTTIAADGAVPAGRSVVATHTYRIANPELLDQVMAFDRLIGNSDRHGGNLLLVPQEDPDGQGTTYTVHLIDHGRSFLSGMNEEDAIAGRVEALSGYLKTLTLPENATHAAHVLPMLHTFANLTVDQLLEDPYRGLPPDAINPEARTMQQALLAAKQQLVRQFLSSQAA